MALQPPVPDAGYPSSTFRSRRRRVRRGNWRLTLTLLLAWALVTFGVAYFARALSFDFFGWPFSFWVGSQGALIVYVTIVVIYARNSQRGYAGPRSYPWMWKSQRRRGSAG